MLLLFLQEFQKSEATDVIEIKLVLPAVVLNELSIKGIVRSYLDLYYLGGDADCSDWSIARLALNADC